MKKLILVRVDGTSCVGVRPDGELRTTSPKLSEDTPLLSLCGERTLVRQASLSEGKPSCKDCLRRLKEIEQSGEE